MKKIFLPLFIIFTAFSLVTMSCKKDKKDDDKKVEDNGLTQQINQLIPDSILTKMVTLGMVINRGETPPSLAGSFFATPFILKASNVPNDFGIGYAFADYNVLFYEQNNDNLTIKVDYFNGPESGSGLGGFIVGTGNNFTVFAEVNSTYAGYSAKMVHVISGTLTATGIQNLYFANFMLDNNDNPGGVWIGEGTGRIIYDSDGQSPRIDTEKSGIIETGKIKSSSGVMIK